jgi:hypothetical protein
MTAGEPVSLAVTGTGVARDVFFEPGRRQAIAGQEDLIVDVVAELSARLAAA